MGRYVGEWVLWLKKTHVGREVLVGSSFYLEEGMARLLQGSVYASLATCGCGILALERPPMAPLMLVGPLGQRQDGPLVCCPPHEFVFHPVSRLPWPTSTGVRWKSVAVEDFWPRSLINLCIPDERPERPSFTGDKRSRRDHDTPAEDSEGDAIPPPLTPAAAASHELGR